MKTLSNDYHDFNLVNLGILEGGRGPYIVRQDGIPPGSDLLQEDRYLLRRDGIWFINYAVFCMPEEDQEEFMFEDVSEVYDLVEGLPGLPEVLEELPKDKSREEIAEAMKQTQDRLWHQIQQARGIKVEPPTTL